MRREQRAISKARRWLIRLSVPEDDIERQVLRLFGLAATRTPSRALVACGRKMAPFDWFRYTGDPVPAMVAHRALEACGSTHPSLAELETGYRSLMAEQSMPLLRDLLGTPGANADLRLPSLPSLVTAPREEVLEICRLITMMTSCGSREMEESESARVLPALAMSYARDWDLETCAALVRAGAYLRVADCPEMRWSAGWLMDQQQTDGRFGLLESPDWQSFFDLTIHAVWALSTLVNVDTTVGAARLEARAP